MIQNLPNEEWKPIEGFEELYHVSNYGRVKSLPRRGTINETRILKPCKNRDGYLQVCLYKDSTKQYKTIHRLVAEAFLPNPNNLPCINHKDENKENNNVENLEYCDIAFNNSYGTRNERVSKAMTNGKLSKTVLQYDRNGNFIREWPSAREIERQLGFVNGNICKCCIGKPHYNTAYNFIWRYKDDIN